MTAVVYVEIGGKRYAVPTQVNGQRIPPQDAVDMFMAGQLKPTSVELTYCSKPEPKKDK